MSIRANILDNLETALNNIKESSSYELPIAEIGRFPVNPNDLQNHRFPYVSIVDAGEESLTVRDATHYQFLMMTPLVADVQTSTEGDLSESLNKLISDLKKFVDSNPSLGSNVLKFRLVGLESTVWKTSAGYMGAATIMTTIRYSCLAGTF